MDLSLGQVSYPFLVTPNCLCQVLEHDSLTKTGAQIYFTPEEAKVLNGIGHPIAVLNVELTDEYKLLETPKEPSHDIQAWL